MIFLELQRSIAALTWGGGKGGHLFFRSTFSAFVTRVLARTVGGLVSGCTHV